MVNKIPIMNKKDFKKLFPTLAVEMETGKSLADIEIEPESPRSERKFQSYNPEAMDFLRRCKTVEQAEEIIAYLEKRKEISRQEANALRKQLKEKGLKSFGPSKKPGFYEKIEENEEEAEELDFEEEIEDEE